MELKDVIHIRIIQSFDIDIQYAKIVHQVIMENGFTEFDGSVFIKKVYFDRDEKEGFISRTKDIINNKSFDIVGESIDELIFDFENDYFTYYFTLLRNEVLAKIMQLEDYAITPILIGAIDDFLREKTYCNICSTDYSSFMNSLVTLRITPVRTDDLQIYTSKSVKEIINLSLDKKSIVEINNNDFFNSSSDDELISYPSDTRFHLHVASMADINTVM